MLAVTSRDLTTIICCLKWFTAETLIVRARVAKTFRAFGDCIFFRIFRATASESVPARWGLYG